MKPLCVALVLIALLIQPAGAADWPRFRGPTGDGHAPDGTTLPDTWGPTSNVAWKADIACQSSPSHSEVDRGT